MSWGTKKNLYVEARFRASFNRCGSPLRLGRTRTGPKTWLTVRWLALAGYANGVCEGKGRGSAKNLTEQFGDAF